MRGLALVFLAGLLIVAPMPVLAEDPPISDADPDGDQGPGLVDAWEAGSGAGPETNVPPGSPSAGQADQSGPSPVAPIPGPDAGSAASRPRSGSWTLPWTDGQAWMVLYTVRGPSPAAVADPPDLVQTQEYSYRVTAENGEGVAWRLAIQSQPARGVERIEVRFDREFRVVSARRFNYWGESFEIANDLESGGFAADGVGVPFLGWPDFSAGERVGDDLVLTQDRDPLAGYRTRFLWKPGKPWWSEAVRTSGGFDSTAVLVER